MQRTYGGYTPAQLLQLGATAAECDMLVHIAQLEKQMAPVRAHGGTEVVAGQGVHYWARKNPDMPWVLLEVQSLAGLHYGLRDWQFAGPLTPPSSQPITVAAPDEWRLLPATPPRELLAEIERIVFRVTLLKNSRKKHGVYVYRNLLDAAAKFAPRPVLPEYDEARERELFEHAERASQLERDDCGDYVNPCVQSCWEGWKAGRAALMERSDG